MSSNKQLSEILALLPGLSPAQLDAVIATATALKAVNQVKPGLGRQAKPAPKAKAKKAKGPAQRVSSYQDKPEYVAFKAKDKDLQKVLKSLSVDLKGLQTLLNDEKECERAFKAPEQERQARVTLAEFLASRDDWFRAKACLSDDSNQVAEEEAGSDVPIQPAEGSARA